MRIPPSLVVMSCVTAVPFGLAIRDTVRHAPRGDELDLTGEQAREREAVAKAEREEAKARAEYEALQREREARIDALYGKAIASPGVAFHGEGMSEHTYEFSNENFVEVFPADEEVGLFSITINVSASLCDKLHEKLIAAWGRAANNIWLDPATHNRAAFSDDACWLRFDKYLAPDQWVAQLPFDKLGANLERIDWRQTGTGIGRDATHVYGETDHGVVVSFNVVGDTDLDTQQAIRDAISQHLNKQPNQDLDDPNMWTWHTQPPVRFDGSGASRFSIQIGKTSWQ